MSLLVCDRHTDKDLSLWAELELADRINAEAMTFATTAARGMQAIRAFHRRPKPYYVATSWGKDSVVLLHLFRGNRYTPKIVHVRQLDNENPECLKVRDAFLREFDCDYEEVAYSYEDAAPSWYDDKGNPIRWFQVLAELQRKYGRHVTGVRADESTARHMRFRRYGIETTWTLAPLNWMTNAHVFAYLSFFDLPIHANYAMTGGGRWAREHLRVSAIGNERGRGFGRLEWEQEYFGDMLNRMEAKRATTR